MPSTSNDSRTYHLVVCCAYECLRIINYLSNANILDIENLLVLGNVISNNMNAGVTWSLLGMKASSPAGDGIIGVRLALINTRPHH